MNSQMSEFFQLMLSAYCVPDTVLGAGKITVNKNRKKISALMGMTLSKERRQ